MLQFENSYVTLDRWGNEAKQRSGKPAFAGTGPLACTASALPLSSNSQTPPVSTILHMFCFTILFFFRLIRSEVSLFVAEASVPSSSVLDLFLHHISGIHACTVIVAGFEAQGSSTYSPVHVINLDIKDNHEEATLGSFLILELCEMVRPSGYIWHVVLCPDYFLHAEGNPLFPSACET